MTLDIPSLIEDGCEETDPITAALYITEDDGDLPQEATKACALGTALVASDSARFDRIVDHLATTRIEEEMLPDVDIRGAKMNAVFRAEGRANLHLVITTLNDRTDMSREAIAQWLDTLPDYKTQVAFDVPTDNPEAESTPVPA